MSSLEKQIKNAKDRLRHTGIKVATAAIVTSSGFNANAGNNSKGDWYEDIKQEWTTDYNTTKQKWAGEYNQYKQDINNNSSSGIVSKNNVVQQSENGETFTLHRNTQLKTGMEPSDLKNTVKELQANGYSNKDIIVALDALVKDFTEPNVDIWSMVKTKAQGICFDEVLKKVEAIFNYGKTFAKENWIKEIINVAQSVSSELKMNEGIDARQVTQNQKEQSRQVQKSNQPQQSDIQLKNLPEKYGVRNLAYGEKDGRVVCSFNSSGPVEYLFPPTYVMKNGEHSIGTVRRLDENMTRNLAELEIRKIIAHQIIASDIQAQAKESGSQLTEAESNFLKSHQKNMKDWGLLVMKDGTICQTQDGTPWKGFTVDGNTTKVAPPTRSNSYFR